MPAVIFKSQTPLRSVTPPEARDRNGCPVQELKSMLRGCGLRPTRQRISLGWLLFGKGDRHITAEMLHDEARGARMPISMATVYNTLHQFKDAGLIRQVAIDGARTYFDTNTSDHHHFYIEGEEGLVDIPGHRFRLRLCPRFRKGWRSTASMWSFACGARGGKAPAVQSSRNRLSQGTGEASKTTRAVSPAAFAGRSSRPVARRTSIPTRSRIRCGVSIVSKGASSSR